VIAPAYAFMRTRVPPGTIVPDFGSSILRAPTCARAPIRVKQNATAPAHTDSTIASSVDIPWEVAMGRLLDFALVRRAILRSCGHFTRRRMNPLSLRSTRAGIRHRGASSSHLETPSGGHGRRARQAVLCVSVECRTGRDGATGPNGFEPRAPAVWMTISPRPRIRRICRAG
jgi:hypothetical protein